MISSSHRPLLLIMSAPSGAGKTTLRDRLLAEFTQMAYSVSCTTRVPRAGEVDGKDYHFLSEPEFVQRLQRGEFLEHAVVHGYKYGTLKEHVLDPLSRGRDVLLVIDVQGAGQIRAQVRKAEADPFLRQAFVDVFIAPPSLEELERRLANRGLDSQETIVQRLRNARGEMAGVGDYQYIVINDRLDAAYDRLRSIVQAEHCRNIGGRG